MKKIFLFLILLISCEGFSQSPAGIWYFGKKAGISFNLGNNPVSLNDGQIDTNEGCATLCDNSGNLLFYTDGIKVWNKNHVVMPNGSGLSGDPSSTQSAIIVPQPNNSSLFFVFTVDELGKANGLQYSIIDLSLDNGNGAIITKNIPLITPALEKITTVQHANGIDFWVIAHKYGTNQFLSYLLSGTGLNTTPIISAVGSVISNDSQRTLGYLKSSPNGQYVASANAGTNGSVQLFNFNNINGQLSFSANLPMNINSIGAYGLEFSSNSKVLYVSRIDYPNSKSEIFQYDLDSQIEATIEASKITVATYVFDEFLEGIITALQLAPNQKIYIGRNNSEFLDAINKPNVVGNGCQYTSNAVSIFPNTCYFGLPSFITSYLDLNFTAFNFCQGNATQFEAPEIDNVVSLLWNFDDPVSSDNTSVANQPTHIYNSTGNYTVTLTVQTLTNTKVFTKQFNIIATPFANSITNFKECETDIDTATFILTDKNNEILAAQNPSDYTISYHLTQNDANNNLAPLSNSYTNVSNPQTIFVRIQPVTGGECSDTTTLQLVAVSKPRINAETTEYYCLNKFPEKITISSGSQNSGQSLTYLWSTGQTTESIQVNEAGDYTITVTNADGCSSSGIIHVVNSEIATVNYNIFGEIGQSILQVIPIGVGNYSFSLDNEFDNYQTSPIFNSIIPGNHIIYVKDENGCGISSALFSVIGYPKYFTPNGDGTNDYWNLQGNFLNIKNTLIYDRYGKLIFEIKPNTVGWDGTFKGRKVISTDYWFTTTMNDGKIIKGHFTLKR